MRPALSLQCLAACQVRSRILFCYNWSKTEHSGEVFGLGPFLFARFCDFDMRRCCDALKPTTLGGSESSGSVYCAGPLPFALGFPAIPLSSEACPGLNEAQSLGLRGWGGGMWARRGGTHPARSWHGGIPRQKTASSPHRWPGRSAARWGRGLGDQGTRSEPAQSRTRPLVGPAPPCLLHPKGR